MTHAFERSDERAWLSEVLTARIPLGGAMALSVEWLDPHGIALAAPLAPNINDKGTAFGGALVSLMILAGWSLPRLLLRRADRHAELVIGRCEVRFLKPVAGPMRAECDWPDEAQCRAFLGDLEGEGKAAMSLAPRLLTADGELAATLQARYAALTGPVSGSREPSGVVR